MNDESTVLLVAVLSASFVGSLHCVGMCGPLALWAAGSERKANRLQRSTAATMYHLGRLLSYAAVGAIAGGLGSIVDQSGQLIGIQLGAAKVAGVILFLAGIGILLRWLNSYTRVQFSSYLRGLRRNSRRRQKTNWYARLLSDWRPTLLELPLNTRGFFTGLLTAFLPCGWLYVFAVVASGSGNSTFGALTMIAFWLGSVPALVAVVATLHTFTNRLRTAAPVLIAASLLWAGGLLFAGRGFANIDSLDNVISTESREALEDSQDSAGLKAIQSDSLPCCAHKAAGEQQP